MMGTHLYDTVSFLRTKLSTAWFLPSTYSLEVSGKVLLIHDLDVPDQKFPLSMGWLTCL